MIKDIAFRRSAEYIAFEANTLALSGNAFLPSTAFVPLLQHSGMGARPVVNPGERVREGQLIARGTGPDSCHIHSPIPGIVQDFRTMPLPDGTMGTTAVIQLSGSFEILGRKQENFPWNHAPESEILRVLEEKGVINTFERPTPLVPQLREARSAGKPILAIRLFDSDPTCQLDSFLYQNDSTVILEGAALIARSIDAETVYLVHSGKKWDGPEPNRLADIFQARRVVTVRGGSRYPSGNTNQIFRLIASTEPDLGKKKPVFIEPVTALSAYDAVVHNHPVMNRFIVVSGPGLGTPAILKVRIGTPIGDIIEESGGFRTKPARIVINGLLAGTAVYDLDTPITKYTKSLHIMDKDTCPDYSVRACIHCGRCLQVCPVRIDPMRVVTGVRVERFTSQLKASLKKCQGCGCCAMVCPSRIPLHHIIREAAERIQGVD